MDQKQFVSEVWGHYQQKGRDLPWRWPELDGSFDAYKIMVSEIMLQQTQVSRVIDKYSDFLEVFPTITALAEASLARVLILWNGLGYNRRAKFLWQAARQLVTQPQPWGYEALLACPGIGPNTAAAIVVYAYNQPKSFIETNIRTVYIHHFFRDATDIPDKAILALLETSYDKRNPREFYWALMDYGSYLKASVGNLTRQSKQYAKQSKFEGSDRQLRGKVLRMLTQGSKSYHDLAAEMKDDRTKAILQNLASEELIDTYQGLYKLP